MKKYRYFFGKRLDKTAFHALIVSARLNEVTQAETKTSNNGETKMEDIRKTTKMQKQIEGKTYDVDVEVIRRKHLTGGTEFRINVTIKLDGHEVHDTMVELAVFKDVAEMFSPDKLAEEENAGYTEGPQKLIKVLRHDGAWTIARAKVEDRFFEINVKHFEEPSRFGIKNGRVSKLWIREEGKTEADVSYDRGWDIRPTTKAAKTITNEILSMYN